MNCSSKLTRTLFEIKYDANDFHKNQIIMQFLNYI